MSTSVKAATAPPKGCYRCYRLCRPPFRENEVLRLSWLLSALAGGFIAAALGAGFGFSSWFARAVIFFGFAAVTYLSIVAEMPGGQSKWWHI
jgi:hypothetical protein